MRRRPPRPDESPYLVGITGLNAGRLFSLEPGACLNVGRAADCDPRLSDDRSASRHHARVEVSEEGVIRLLDVGATNGTVVNGEPIRERELQRGDWIQLGELSRFKLEWLSPEEVALRLAALIDQLTSCWNDRHERLVRPDLFSQSRELGQPLSFVVVDVDHFHEFNRRHGLQAGDQVLAEVARRLRHGLKGSRHDGQLHRHGGEEFLMMLANCPADAALKVAERARRAVGDSPVACEGESLRVTASFGVATWPDDPVDSDHELFAVADRRQVRAKDLGRNRVVGGEARGPAAGPAAD